MKRAWVNVEEWEGRTIGSIERISNVEDWPIFCVYKGWVIPVDFDESTIEPYYEKAIQVNGTWEIIEDTTKKEEDSIRDLENSKIKWEEKCLDGGYKAQAKFNRLLSKYEYGDTEQEFFMTDSDFQLVDYLLNHGALNKAIGLLTMKEPISYYTENFKSEYIAIVQAISDEIGNEPV